MLVGVVLGGSVKQVQAAYFDREKLAHALATHFHLNESEVTSFLADFQYHPDSYQTTAAASTKPSPTPATKAGQTKVENKVSYQYDEYTDKYYTAGTIVDVQHRNNLKFIEEQLNNEVRAGRMTVALKKAILDKLAELMNKAPSTAEFLKMSFLEQRGEINKFKNEMNAWMKENGMTLAQLRAITGKGNKFLMGIYY